MSRFHIFHANFTDNRERIVFSILIIEMKRSENRYILKRVSPTIAVYQ